MVSFLEVHGLKQYPTSRFSHEFAVLPPLDVFYALSSSCCVMANFLSRSSECNSAWRSTIVEIGGGGRGKTALGGTLGYSF